MDRRLDGLEVMARGVAIWSESNALLAKVIIVAVLALVPHTLDHAEADVAINILVDHLFLIL